MKKALLPIPHKILVIRYRFIGDTILTVPFLRNLRLAYPQAIIDVLVGPQSGDVLEGCPYINNLIVFDTTRFHKYDRGNGEKKGFWSYVFALRKNQYDTAFVLKRSWSSALLALLIGARHRIGYATEGRQILLTHSVPHDPNTHEVESTLTVLGCAGIPVKDNYLESWISEEEQNQIDALPEMERQAETTKKVLVHAAAAHPDKLYPLESWAKIIRLLSIEHNFVPVFTGAEQDIALYQKLEQLSGVACINLVGKLSLRLSMALYSNLDLAICTDSGPAHLAAASGIPTIAIFGPTDPERWRPYIALVRSKKRGLTSDLRVFENEAIYKEDLACRPCNYNKTCIDRPCLTDLAPDIVVLRAIGLWQRFQGKYESPVASS